MGRPFLGKRTIVGGALPVGAYRIPSAPADAAPVVPALPAQARELVGPPAFSHGTEHPRAARFVRGGRVVTVDGQYARLFSALTGEEIASRHLPEARALTLSSDGGSVLVASRRAIAVLTVDELQPTRQVALEGEPHGVTISPCGRWIAIRMLDRCEIWGSDLERRISTIKGPGKDPVFTRDGERLFALDEIFLPSKSVQMHAVPSGRRLARLRGDVKRGRGGLGYGVTIAATAIVQVGERILMSSGPEQRNLYEVHARKTWYGRHVLELSLFREGSRKVRQLTASDAAMRVAVGVDEGLEVFDVTSPSRCSVFKPADAPFDFSPDASQLIAKVNHRVTILSFDDGPPARPRVPPVAAARRSDGGLVLGARGAHDGPVRGLSFSPDGRRLASAATDGWRVWSPTTGELLSKLTLPTTPHEESPFALQLRADGQLTSVDAVFLACSSPRANDRHVYAVDLMEGAPVVAAAVDPTGARIAVLCESNVGHLVDVATLSSISRFVAEANDREDIGICFGAGLDDVLVAYDRRVTRLVPGAESGRLEPLFEHAASSCRLRRDPARDALWIGGNRGFPMIAHRLSSGAPIPEVGTLPLESAVDPRGRFMAARVSFDKVLVRSLPDEARRTLAVDGEVTALAFSPDGQRLAVGVGVGTIVVWTLID